MVSPWSRFLIIFTASWHIFTVNACRKTGNYLTLLGKISRLLALYTELSFNRSTLCVE